MNTTLNAPSPNTPLVTRTVAPFAAITVMAVVVAGFAAAHAGATLAWILTPLVAVVILRAAVRSSAPPAGPGVDARELPLPLRHHVSAAFDQLSEGDARRLLMEVLIQARPLYAARSTTFDATADAMSRENASALLDACCDSALELARLDAAFSGRVGSAVEPRYAPARELFTRRLTDAAAALGALYASGVEHGTPASDRVAELASEIKADARARSAAGDEISSLIPQS